MTGTRAGSDEGTGKRAGAGGEGISGAVLGALPTYVGTSGVVTGTPNNVPGLAAGDFAIRIGWPYGGGMGVGAAGWTMLEESPGNGLVISYKFVTAGDVASGWSTGGQTLEVAFAYRGVGSLDGLTGAVLDTITATDATTKTINTLTTAVDNCKVIYVMLGFDDNAATWTTAAEIFDVNTLVSADSTYSLASLDQVSAGAVPSVTCDMSGTDTFRVFALILQPLGAP